MIIYVDDANDEVPVFTQQQYNRLGLRETAGIGTSVIVVRATDRDTGKFGFKYGKKRECLIPDLFNNHSASGFLHPTPNGNTYLAVLFSIVCAFDHQLADQ